MGFGLLFFGYCLEFILGLNRYGVFVYLLGYGIMLSGLTHLSRYCHRFRPAQYTTWALMLMAVYHTFAGIEGLTTVSFPFVTETLTQVVDWIDFALVLLFHLFLALGIRELALRVGLTKNGVFAIRNFLLVLLCDIVYLSGRFLPLKEGYLTVPFWILRLLWAVLNGVLLYSCYMRICPANEPEHVRKPSRIGWINRLQKAFDEKEKAAIEADRAYHEENARRRKEKYISNMKKKKKK